MRLLLSLSHHVDGWRGGGILPVAWVVLGGRAGKRLCLCLQDFRVGTCVCVREHFLGQLQYKLILLICGFDTPPPTVAQGAAVQWLSLPGGCSGAFRFPKEAGMAQQGNRTPCPTPAVDYEGPCGAFALVSWSRAGHALCVWGLSGCQQALQALPSPAHPAVLKLTEQSTVERHCAPQFKQGAWHV